MAAPEIAEFCIVTFKDDFTYPSPAASFLDELTFVPGVLGVYFGQQRENPAVHALALHWRADADFDAFVKSDAFHPWEERYKAAFDTVQWAKAALGPGTAAALAAPTTEILFAYGIGDKFPGNLATFAGKMVEVGLDGAHSVTFGETLKPISREPGGEKAPAAMLVLGWDSMEKHHEVKATPGNAIVQNIGLLQSDRASLQMFHVVFKKL